jgi:sulfur-carrier protein
MTTIRIPPTLRTATEGRREVEIAGATVREILNALVAEFPGLEGRLLEQGQVRPFVNVFLDGVNVRERDGLDTAVGADSTLLLLPAMAGGS